MKQLGLFGKHTNLHQFFRCKPEHGREHHCRQRRIQCGIVQYTKHVDQNADLPCFQIALFLRALHRNAGFFQSVGICRTGIIISQKHAEIPILTGTSYAVLLHHRCIFCNHLPDFPNDISHFCIAFFIRFQNCHADFLLLFRQDLGNGRAGIQRLRFVIDHIAAGSRHQVAADEVDKVQNRRNASEILVQHNGIAHAVRLSGRGNGITEVLRICQAEPIDRLLDITYQKNVFPVTQSSGLGFNAIAGEQLENIVLLVVGILIFIDHDQLIVCLQFLCQRGRKNSAVFLRHCEKFQCHAFRIVKGQGILPHFLFPDFRGNLFFQFQQQRHQLCRLCQIFRRIGVDSFYLQHRIFYHAFIHVTE